VLERISSANLATFFSIVGGMSLGSAVLLVVAVAALSRGFVALVQGGLSPAAAYLRGRLGLAALLLAVALVVLSGVIASAVTPAASFMGVGIIFMVPGLSLLAYFFLILFFTYFYVAITFNPTEVADNMKKYGGFIPGIRAGRPTAEYLDYVLTRLTLPGALYLAVIAIIPSVAFVSLGVANRFLFGGTSLLIMVGVGLDTVKQIESQLQQRNYEGFLR